jgi:hypothetical protein
MSIHDRANWDLSKKRGRGREQRSLDLIEAMHAAAERAHPITGRGVGYKLFVAGLIASMEKNVMKTSVVNEAEQKSLKTILDKWRG